jgi:hypothetical protein
VILFCAATGIAHAAVGILAHAMQSMVIRGFIAHNRESGAYTLTDSGRATLGAVAIPKKPQTARSKRGNVPPLQ